MIESTLYFMANPKSDILIIGAGVIGLSCAYELSKRGANVTVVDKGRTRLRLLLRKCRLDYALLRTSTSHARNVRKILEMAGSIP